MITKNNIEGKIEIIQVYKGTFDKLEGYTEYGNGTIIKEGNKVTLFRDDGKSIILPKLDDSDVFFGYGNGAIVNRGDVITAYRDDGEVVKLYEGKFEKEDYCRSNGLRGYGNGVIVRKKNMLIACRDDGKSVKLFEGEFEIDNFGKSKFDPSRIDHWIGYRNGVIVRNRKEITAYRDDGKSVKLYNKSAFHFEPYNKGIIVKEGNEVIACRDDGRSNILFKKGSDDDYWWSSYGNGALVQLLREDKDGINAYRDDGKSFRLYDGASLHHSGYGNGIIVQENYKFFNRLVLNMHKDPLRELK